MFLECRKLTMSYHLGDAVLILIINICSLLNEAFTLFVSAFVTLFKKLMTLYMFAQQCETAILKYLSGFAFREEICGTTALNFKIT